MNNTAEIIETERAITIEQRRAHLKKTLVERRRELSEQAEKMIEHYEAEKKEREAWQGGDIVEF